MVRSRRTQTHASLGALGGGLLLETERFVGRLAVGTWVPNVDLCETREALLVRIELPGIALTDVRVTIDRSVLRVQGMKREQPASSKLLCYYCLERSYGRFSREIPLERVVDTKRARAILSNGILTIELPKVVDRRGSAFEVPIEKR